MPDQPILVVDDDPSILNTVADILRLEGYRVETAADGAEGINVAARVAPALVLLDMRMPVMDGWGFAETARTRQLDLKILVMTAAQDARRWAQEIGAKGYIGKPFDLDDLLAEVERVREDP